MQQSVIVIGHTFKTPLKHVI